jgi:hypothetical protein
MDRVTGFAIRHVTIDRRYLHWNPRAHAGISSGAAILLAFLLIKGLNVSVVNLPGN